MLKDRDIAPNFSLPDQDGEIHKLSDYKGQYVVLYFYPKDDTAGCTKEACSFRDDFSAYKKKWVVILGVSADDKASHKKFAGKYNLPFTLLSDPERKVIEKYGVWKEKSLYGRKFMGIERTTFIIY